MSTKEIEQAILDMFKKIYCAEYTGKIDVIPLYESFTFPGDQPKVCGYTLRLGLNREERPLNIACDGTPEQFLKYVEKELHERNLVRTDYFTAIQFYPEDVQTKQGICTGQH